MSLQRFTTRSRKVGEDELSLAALTSGSVELIYMYIMKRGKNGQIIRGGFAEPGLGRCGEAATMGTNE